MRRSILIISLLALTAGCATTSFGPPDVALPNNRTKNLSTALADVDSLITSYSARSRQAANGRQIFEVPAFLATVGAVTATAFGAGPNVTIASGATAALLGGGKSYYAPKTKSEIYSKATSALLCIQQVATDVSPFVTAASGSEPRLTAVAANGDDEAYYYLVRNAALSVREILTNRLSNAGSLTDAQGLAAEYEKHIKEQVKKENEAPAIKNSVTALGFVNTSTVSDDDRAKLNALQPKLQVCVLTAKS